MLPTRRRAVQTARESDGRRAQRRGRRMCRLRTGLRQGLALPLPTATADHRTTGDRYVGGAWPATHRATGSYGAGPAPGHGVYVECPGQVQPLLRNGARSGQGDDAPDPVGGCPVGGNRGGLPQRQGIDRLEPVQSAPMGGSRTPASAHDPSVAPKVQQGTPRPADGARLRVGVGVLERRPGQAGGAVLEWPPGRPGWCYSSMRWSSTALRSPAARPSTTRRHRLSVVESGSPVSRSSVSQRVTYQQWSAKAS